MAALAISLKTGAAVFAPVLQWPVVVRPFGGADAGQVINDLVPFAIVHLLPLLGVLGAVALSVGALRHKPAITAPLVGSVLGGLLVLLGAAASAANHVGSAGLVGTTFEEGAMLAVVYGGAVAAMGAVAYWGPKWWGRLMPRTVSTLLVLLAGLGGILASLPMLVAGFLDQPGAVFPTVEVGADAVVYFPEQKVVHTGDLFLSFPRPPDKPPGAGIYVDYAQGGSFLEWTATLDRVLTLDFDTVIPGHGPVATRADLVKFRANVRGRAVCDLAIAPVCDLALEDIEVAED